MEHCENGIQISMFLLLLMSTYVMADIVINNQTVYERSRYFNSSSTQSCPCYNIYNNDAEEHPPGNNQIDEYLNLSRMSCISNVENETIVLTLQVTDQHGDPATFVVFNRNMFIRFHECLCDNKSLSCCANIDKTSNVTSVTQKNGLHYYDGLVVCSLEDNSTLDCTKRTDQYLSSDHVMLVYGATCIYEKYIFWDMSQNVKFNGIHPVIQTTCPFSRGSDSGSQTFWSTVRNMDTTDSKRTGSGLMLPPSTTSKLHTSSEENKVNGDDEAFPISIIGIIVACVVIFIIAIIIVILFVIRKRRKSKESSGTSSGRSSNSVNRVSRDQDLNLTKKKNGNHQLSRNHREGSRSTSSTTLTARDHSLGSRSSTTTVKGNTMHNIYTTHGNNSSGDGRSSNAPSTVGDNVYASIDDTLGIRNEYTVLDESTKYGHMYNGLLTSDPKLRPQMPLPLHLTNQNLPYYSLAQLSDVDSSNQNNYSVDSTNQNIYYVDSTNQNSETASTQYLELLDENSIPNLQMSNADYLVPASISSLTNDNDLESNSYISLVSTNDIPEQS